MLIEQVGVGAEGHRGRVTGLAGDLDDGRALGDEEAHEAMAEVIRPRVRDPGLGGCFGERALAPVAGTIGAPGRAVGGREQEVDLGVSVGGAAPRVEVLGKRREQADGARAARLGRLELTERNGAFDEHRALADVVPAQPDRLAGSQAGIREDGDERGVELRTFRIAGSPTPAAAISARTSVISSVVRAWSRTSPRRGMMWTSSAEA
jgi:hypothetical protein